MNVELELLFVRLRWPVASARWWVMQELADLLVKPDLGDQVLARLTHELRECRLEAEATEVLSILWMAFHKGWVPPKDLGDAVLRPSMLTLAKGDGLNQLLREHVEPAIQKSRKVEEESGDKDWKIPELLKTAARVSWRDATCLMPVDEFQWIAASSEANARASTVLLKLHSIGPLLLFCANFSLVRKLERRPPEDRDRLLSRPIILLPLAADDPDWTAYLNAARSVEPDVLKFDPVVDGKKIHDYTFGIKRKVVDLIETAVRMARSRSAEATVGVDELLAAYRSAAYAMHRTDVEALLRQGITGTSEREDLVCPFTSTATDASNVKAVSAAVERFEKHTEEAILADAMLPSEAAAHRKITSETAPKTQAGKVLRFKNRKVTKEDLLAGAAALDAVE
ncbi:hypothetical protein BurJ1DRAFT_0646 [Burkholderiales bacterium JOSHI_001]|nr:hypothetical protein BurJ1DRAFT_0646 [Burkholderiales bacterium JOSHI_001]